MAVGYGPKDKTYTAQPAVQAALNRYYGIGQTFDSCDFELQDPLACLPNLFKAFFNHTPVNNFPESLNVVGSTILVVEVVGMLPHIAG